ncbi:ABC transporter permease [Aquabacter spiritensis]|uniref:NitT/TauT family transport system permease protein/sulfonate transport system permease protein n=1 Tax=Aquabacter spiritensis TaxID=933073 RepID=A0A4V2UXJ9_9HYPH|nr:ABC transporter permease [Aquabacter spiritensis]TCT03838.1 NitT/TauT family transport system permease protein/sulfonate transport system permease protein [Aquabacter spiritensis]
MAMMASSKSAAVTAQAGPARRAFRLRLPSRERLLGLGTIAAFLLLWQVVYSLALMPKWAFPSPWQVVLAFYELSLNGVLLTNTAASVGRQISGVALAALVGIPAGLVMGASPTVRAAFLPLCRMLYPIPGIAWIPLAILWFGIGFTSTVFVIFFSGIWSIMFNTMTGVQTLSGQYTEVARVYLASRSLYTRRILIPGSLPYIITGMRLTYGVGWRVIVGAEMISSITGLGFLIDDARWQLRPDIMICGMITIAMIGWVSENWFFDWVERKTVERWGMKTV